VFSSSGFQDILDRTKNLSGTRDHNHAPFRDGLLVLATMNLHTKFEISTITHYEDMKGDGNENWGGLGVKGYSRLSAT